MLKIHLCEQGVSDGGYNKLVFIQILIIQRFSQVKILKIGADYRKEGHF